MDISAKIRDVNLAAVVAEAGVSLKGGGGGRLVGLCPLHDEKSPSFTVYPDKNTFYCFGCGVGGDAAEFVMKSHGVEFTEALRRLGVKNDDKKPYEPAGRRPKVNKPVPAAKKPPPVVYGRPPGLWVEKATKFACWCHERLLENNWQMDWLAARGIDRAAAVKHRLGWNPGESDEKPQFFRHRSSWGLADEIKPNGKKKMLWLPRGLVIPLVAGDDVLRLRIRGDKPRYYVVPGSNMDLMVINGEHRCLVVVESELDAILLDTVAGDLAGYIALGTSRAKPDSQTDYYLRKTSYIIVSLDYDDAGARALDWWAEHFPRAMVWPQAGGKDPGEAYQAGCDLREWILAAYPDGWHVQRAAKKRRPVKNSQPAEKSAAGHNLPSGVAQLAELMRQTPVAVVVTPNRLKISAPPGWSRENWKKLGQISQLVYFTPDVFEYLHDHGGNYITWRDF